MTIYVIHAYRYGDRERHSYQVGASLDRDEAFSIADDERVRRAGKYEMEIMAWQSMDMWSIVRALPYHRDGSPTGEGSGGDIRGKGGDVQAKY
jgi:hypothetical protein